MAKNRDTLDYQNCKGGTLSSTTKDLSIRAMLCVHDQIGTNLPVLPSLASPVDALYLIGSGNRCDGL
jgi:hypothetical protein